MLPAPRIVGAALLILMVGVSLHATVRIAITEVLKDPIGPETACPGGKCHEFVEFVNLGGDTVSLDSLFLSDGSTVNAVIPWRFPLAWHANCCFNRTAILPGQFALILDRDYEDAPPGSYFTIADSAVIFTVDAASLAGGLTLTKGVFLYRGTRTAIVDSLAAMIDSGFSVTLEGRVNHTQPKNMAEGYSNIPAHLLFSSSRYLASPDTLSMGSYEFMRHGWICEYRLSNPGFSSATVVCSLALLRAGMKQPCGGRWIIKIVDSSAEIASGDLPLLPYPVSFTVRLPKDSVGYECVIEENGVRAVFPIDISGVWLPSSPIKINEIFPRASPDVPEWIELVNNSPMPVNLKNWRFGTAENTENIISESDVIVGPGRFLVLTQNNARFSRVYPVGVATVQPAGWQALNNYRDTVVLVSPLEAAFCEVAYYDYTWFGSWKNQSVERVRLDYSGTDRRSWALAQNPTPGRPNAGSVWQSGDKPSMAIGPVPFSPNNDGVDDSLSVRIVLPASWQVSVAIYGFDGRILYRLPEPVEQKSTWNGRKSDGSHAPAGPFFVVATFKDGGKERVIRKKGVLWR